MTQNETDTTTQVPNTRPTRKRKTRPRPTYTVIRLRGRNSQQGRSVYEGPNRARAERYFARIKEKLRQGIVRLVETDDQSGQPGHILLEYTDRALILCADCGINTLTTDNHYMLRDDLWAQIKPEIKGRLCIACAERRLGRPFAPEDMKDIPFFYFSNPYIRALHAQKGNG